MPAPVNPRHPHWHVAPYHNWYIWLGSRVSTPQSWSKFLLIPSPCAAVAQETRVARLANSRFPARRFPLRRRRTLSPAPPSPRTRPRGPDAHPTRVSHSPWVHGQTSVGGSRHCTQRRLPGASGQIPSSRGQIPSGVHPRRLAADCSDLAVLPATQAAVVFPTASSKASSRFCLFLMPSSRSCSF